MRVLVFLFLEKKELEAESFPHEAEERVASDSVRSQRKQEKDPELFVWVSRRRIMVKLMQSGL